MYERYYGLTTKPFSLLSDPDFLWLGSKHQMALSMLEYGLVNQAGFVVITGEPGTGKTTLLRKLLAEHQQRFVVGTISNTPSDIEALMPWILLAFNLPQPSGDRIEAYQTFSNFLHEQAARQQRVLLIVDEAQNLGAQLLEELRLLSNLNDSKVQLIQVILSGQPDLRELLQRPDLKQFAQRISVDYHLAPLAPEELSTYVHHRTTVAGCQRPLFTERACRVIGLLSGGVPRLVNQICDASLAYGFAEQTPVITARIASTAGLDRAKGGLLPNFQESDVMALVESAAWPDEISETEPSTARSRGERRHSPRRYPSSPEPMHRGESPSGQSHDDPDTVYEGGVELRKAEQYLEAIALFRSLTNNPSYALQAYAQIGMCLRSSNKLPEAVVALRKALGTQAAQLDHRTVNIHYLLGRTLEELGRLSEAVSAYRRVHRIDPTYKDVAARLAQVTSASGQLKPTGTEGSWMGQTIKRVFGQK